ncbi:unnamed protein product [Effrenium voratum]|nr:unnamed protein product [Effrenium voratum]
MDRRFAGCSVAVLSASRRRGLGRVLLAAALLGLLAPCWVGVAGGRPPARGIGDGASVGGGTEGSSRPQNVQREAKAKGAKSQKGFTKKAVEAKEAADNESDEDREFRERYLSAEKEVEPEWKRRMKAAKTKEDRFKVGLQVGDFKTSYSIFFDELLGSFAEGDKGRLDEFLRKVGIAEWQLVLVQAVVIGVPFAGITKLTGVW